MMLDASNSRGGFPGDPLVVTEWEVSFAQRMAPDVNGECGALRIFVAKSFDGKTGGVLFCLMIELLASVGHIGVHGMMIASRREDLVRKIRLEDVPEFIKLQDSIAVENNY